MKHHLTRRQFLKTTGLGIACLLTPRLGSGEQVSGKYSPGITKRLSDPRLLAHGQTRIYSGEHLPAISLSVGGIGAGCIQINGKAERHIWQIFNNYTQAYVPHSFFAVRAKTRNSNSIIRALQTSAVGPFAAMKSLSFRGEYPFGWYDFEDAELPVKVSMETFNPLIPLNDKDSAIPCAFFNLTAKNTSHEKVKVSFLATQQNAVGFTGQGKIQGRQFKEYGGNKNHVVKETAATMLHMTSDKTKEQQGYGDIVLVTFEEDATAAASWESVGTLWKGWSQDGTLSGSNKAGPSPAGQTLDGALAVSFTLKPREQHTVRFALTWHFPNARHESGKWRHQGNMYADWWSDALDVARYVNERLDELTCLTRLYHDIFYASNLPHWLLDRISSQLAVLSSKTCFWARDGYFGGWEGCTLTSGCCSGNCAHVWHYAQAHARLFPQIARRMREQSFGAQNNDGGIPYRQPTGKVAFDGQCGEILGAYREHLTNADRAWLGKRWPQIKKAMDYVIARWDDDEDGVPAGPQHNTLDGELGGSTSWLGTMYLAALAASEKMAILEGEQKSAGRYRRIRESGSKKQNETLWNEEYYIQLPDTQPRQDYVNGCHIDQLLGQWWANQLGLEPHYPRQRVRSALQSLFKYNFRTNFHGIKQLPRKFVDENDAGMQMITWPKGARPARYMRYADEVMSGFEYSAAAAMVQASMLNEGFMVVLAASDRYDGRLRTGLTGTAWGYSGNPFGDDECGKFYARPMSIWSMLLACQGFIYDGPAGVIGFKPVWKPEDHISFFTGAEGWGLFCQKRGGDKQSHRIEVTHGKLVVRQMIFELAEGAKPVDVGVNINGNKVPSRFSHTVSDLNIHFANAITIGAGQTLTIEVQTGK